MFKPGDYVVHKSGGPVYIIEKPSALLPNGWVVKRWNGIRFIPEHFATETIRIATSGEVTAMNKPK